MKKSPYTLQAAIRRQRFLITILLLLVAVVLPLGLLVSVPTAGYALGGILILAALLRLSLDADYLGALVVRRKWIDVLILLTLGISIILLSTSPNL